jgi:hypothetical protein
MTRIQEKDKNARTREEYKNETRIQELDKGKRTRQ